MYGDQLIAAILYEATLALIGLLLSLLWFYIRIAIAFWKDGKSGCDTGEHVEVLKPPYCIPCFDRRRFREYSDCRADVASRLYHSGGGRIAQRCHLAARNYKNLFYSGSDSPYLLIKPLRQPSSISVYSTHER